MNEKSNQLITTEMIQARAYEISKFREQNGKSGNPESDWNEAKEQLKQELTNKDKNNTLRQLFFYINQPLIKVEKNVWEPIDDWLKNAAIIQIFAKLSPILEAIGVLLIPVAIWWFTQSNEKIKEQQQKEIRAQQAVQSYLNQLSGILVQDNLEKNEKLRTIIRASTLALLENPDLQRKPNKTEEKDRRRQIIGYLSETKLIILSSESKRDKPIISLERANLKGANLKVANLRGANLGGAYLRGAFLGGANLRGAFLRAANLGWANLRGAKLERAFLRDANLERANLGGANLGGAFLRPANLGGANLEGANLGGANLEKAFLKRAKLKGAFLGEAKLERAKLERANLERANLERANLEGAKLERAFLRAANLERANLERANLERANLERANLERANLERANLRGANLRGAYLEEANLQGAYLQGAYLQGAYLQGAYLQGASLQGAKLQGADLQGAKYTNKNTKQVICNRYFLLYPCPTIFPKNFNPKEAGMVLLKNKE